MHPIIQFGDYAGTAVFAISGGLAAAQKRLDITGFVLLAFVTAVGGGTMRDLREVDVKIPLGVFCCVTGVSGSGKSTLVNEILYKAVANRLHRAKLLPGTHRRIRGLEHLDKVIDIDQRPIGRTPRSNPATYTKVFDAIREVFAMTATDAHRTPAAAAMLDTLKAVASRYETRRPQLQLVG